MKTLKNLFAILMFIIGSPILITAFVAVFLYQYAWLGGYWAIVAFNAMIPRKGD